MSQSSPRAPGGPLLTPEATLIIAVILASAGAVAAIVLVVVTGLRGGRPSDAIPTAAVVLVVALAVAGGIIAYGKRAARRQRPEWMAATTEWRHEIEERQEEYQAKHTPVPPTQGGSKTGS